MTLRTVMIVTAVSCIVKADTSNGNSFENVQTDGKQTASDVDIISLLSVPNSSPGIPRELHSEQCQQAHPTEGPQKPLTKYFLESRQLPSERVDELSGDNEIIKNYETDSIRSPGIPRDRSLSDARGPARTREGPRPPSNTTEPLAPNSNATVSLTGSAERENATARCGFGFGGGSFFPGFGNPGFVNPGFVNPGFVNPNFPGFGVGGGITVGRFNTPQNRFFMGR